MTVTTNELESLCGTELPSFIVSVPYVKCVVDTAIVAHFWCARHSFCYPKWTPCSIHMLFPIQLTATNATLNVA
jgi:hypothetical protein